MDEIRKLMIPCLGEIDQTEQPLLAAAYVKPQQFVKIYDNTTAFSRGTIFEQLDLPFMGSEGCCNE